MPPTVRTLHGDQLLAHADGIRAVYREVFCAPPWNEAPEEADAYLQRLPADTTHPGFTAAVAVDGAELAGFATAWTTRTPLPGDRRYPQVAAALGPERTRRWLCGGREVDELAVRPSAQGSGLGAALLAAVTAGTTDGRCWLLTSVHATQTVGFYRRLGWTQATQPAPDGTGTVVFLGPDHPAPRPAL